MITQEKQGHGMAEILRRGIAAILLGLLSPLLLVIALAVRWTSPGPAFHRSRRVGANNQLFTMYKFRTMWVDSPQVATHLLNNAETHLTPIGSWLRKTSLDELPQVINVLLGDMAFIGPRPALFNQDDLVTMRTQRGVHRHKPGITGWAQTHGRDEIPIPQKVELDAYYLEHRSFALDLRILWLTILNVIRGKDVSH
jgi:O-antigen biosynthesis protein WbqP